MVLKNINNLINFLYILNCNIKCNILIVKNDKRNIKIKGL